MRASRRDTKRRADRKAIQLRIREIESALARADEYLATGAHADWRGFRRLFAGDATRPEQRPPHRDWIENVFIARCRRQLRAAEKALDRLDE